ncbi:hypothetical protein LINGRAHAP2_LOCUS4955 [Linum grandiflorum]
MPIDPAPLISRKVQGLVHEVYVGSLSRGNSQSIQGIVRKFFQELALWNNHLVPVPSPVSSQGLNGATETNQRFNQQPNDQMSRSVHRRLLCDGSFRKDVQKAGIGVICVNHEGHVVDGMAG